MADSTQFQVDRGSGVPLGQQLTDKLERLIGDRVLKPGQQLPSVRELATLAGVNVNTVRTVYGRLEQRGLLSSEHGRGTFVQGVRPLASDALKGSDPSGRGYRRELLRQIGELERQLAYYTRHQIAGAPDRPRTRPASQLLPATELMAVRDDLLGHVERLRSVEEERLRALAADKAAQEADSLAERAAEVQAAGRATRGTASSPPRVVPSPGAWVLKWRG